MLDEPLANLDYKLREQLREEFKNIFNAKASGNAILVYSTTDPVEAMQLGDEIIMMDEGRILQQASAQKIYENPKTTKVAQITNDPAMKLLEGEVADIKLVLSPTISLDLPPHLAALPRGRFPCGIRASGITLDSGGFPFQIELAEISGLEMFLHLHLQHEQLQVVGLLDSVQNFDIGQTVTAGIDSKSLYAFDQSGNLVSSPYGGTK